MSEAVHALSTPDCCCRAIQAQTLQCAALVRLTNQALLLLLLCCSQVAGVNFEEMVEAAMGDKLDLSKPLLDYESGNDVITVFLE